MRRLILAAALMSAAGSAAFPAGPAVGPGEPEILLPKVILEIEDLSVEKLDAQLPPEEELLPARREIPLPAEGELPVGEASLPMPGVGSESQTPAGSGRPIAAEAVLGAGMQSSILGSLSLKTLGKDPRLSFQFSHESLDGFFANPPHPAGSGFGKRNDDLSGELSSRLGPVEADVRGSFSEAETGLQGQTEGKSPTYITGLLRDANGSADFSFSPIEWLTLRGAVGGGYLSDTLTGPAPAPASEYRIDPLLAATARFESVRFGLTAEYSYRSAQIDSLPAQDIHRVRTGLSLGVDLPASLLLEGSAALFWSTASASLLPFPFELALSGTPVDFLTFRVGFGYRVQPYDLKDVLAETPLLLPAVVADDRGWFAEVRVQVAPAQSFSVSGAVSFMASEAMLDAETNPDGTLMQDPTTGLFIPQSVAGNRLSSDLGVRWNAVPGLTLSAGWKHEFREFLFVTSPSFLPVDDITVEGVGLASDGAFGGNISAALRTGTAPFQLPEVNLGGFFRISEAVRLQVDVEDLLQPALQGPRYGLYPYIDPGFRVTGKIRVSF